MWTGNRSLEQSAARLRELLAPLSRFRWVLLAWVVVWAGIGLLFCLSVRPQFVARTAILMEPRHIANDGPEDQRHYHQFALDTEQADTELHVLHSDRLLRAVFDELQLAQTPELLSGRDGIWSALSHWLHGMSPISVPDRGADRAFYQFSDRVRALRLGLSYVLELSYRSGNPDTAATVANAIAAAYVHNRLEQIRERILRAGGAYSAGQAGALAAAILRSDSVIRTGDPLGDDGNFADVRVLGPATPPLRKSYPRTGPTVLFAMGFGTLSGVMLLIFQGAMADDRARRRIELSARSSLWRAARSVNAGGESRVDDAPRSPRGSVA